ncbi:MAG TPA: glycosyltransferase family 1 protein [Roseiarcus sp.]|nr:glycosyltransferase family 1 protein [Roseiarcus sp.]
MRSRPVVYDVSRLISRVFDRTPNGIDRVDFALANHFVDPAVSNRSGMMITAIGPRVLEPRAAREALANIRRHWGEDEAPETDAHFLEVAAAIDGGPGAMRRVSKRRKGQYADAVAWIGRHGFPVGRSPRAFLSDGGVYLNVSQFLVEFEWPFRWTRGRPDVDCVFFVHDLLPIEAPEYFRPSERPRHLRRMATIARLARAVIVSTEVVREGVRRHMSGLGRRDMPILVAPPPPDPIFLEPPCGKVAVARHPYFVACGTIEPRKNHLLLLNVWRDIVARLGQEAPKLVLVGERGWENEHVLDLLERCPSLQGHVIEASGLPTPSVKRLLLGARAVLLPTFAEGYGLPLVEALALGAPVIASDIPVFHEVGKGAALTLDPIDGPAWRDAICAFANADSTPRRERLELSGRWPRPDPADFFAAIEEFLADLARPAHAIGRARAS